MSRPSHPSVLIAGAGYIGSSLITALAGKGYPSLYALKRQAAEMPKAQVLLGDLLQPETLKQLPGCEILVYCAAADAYTEASYQALYAEGLRNIVHQQHQAGKLRKIIYVSSTSVYAESQGQWVEEDAPLVERGPSLALCFAEEWLLSRPEASVSLRFGGIYGPERQSFFNRVRAGGECLYEPSGLYTNRIHRDDAIALLIFAIEQDLPHRCYNAVDGDAADRNEVIRWMYQQLGLDPSSLISTRDLGRIAHRGNKRVSNRRLLATGFVFKYPSFREGYLELCQSISEPKPSG